MLANVTFTGETASGWQQAFFDQPVAITKATTYIVTYYSPTGYFAYNPGYFQGHAVDRAPLHAPAAGAGGTNLTGNGVYSSRWAAVSPTLRRQRQLLGRSRLRPVPARARESR